MSWKVLFVVVLAVALTSAAWGGEEFSNPKCGRISADVSIIEPEDGAVTVDLDEYPVSAKFELSKKLIQKGPIRVDLILRRAFEEMTVFEEFGGCVLKLSPTKARVKNGRKLRWRVDVAKCWTSNPLLVEWSVETPEVGDLLRQGSFFVTAVLDFFQGPGAYQVEAVLSSEWASMSWSDATLFHVIQCNECTGSCDSGCCLPWAPDGECCDDPCWNEVEPTPFCCGFIAEGVRTVCMPGVGCLLDQ